MRARRTWVSVTIDPVNHTGSVSAADAKELIERCGGRPYWSRSRRVWLTTEKVAGDVLALAEAEGRAVRYETVKRGER